uniref:DUF2267 domain-containing protein n=1 Tax=Phaeodactylum tricornutum TaxID=2850 RepID=A0A8J9TGE1_PHATR
MEELTITVAEKLGIDTAVAQKAIGAILRFVQEQSTPDLFAKIRSMDGVENLMKDDDAAEAVREGHDKAEAGGVGGGLFGLIFTLLKAFGLFAIIKQVLSTLPGIGPQAVRMIESVEDGAELTVVLKQLGIDREQGVSMVRMMMDFIKDRLDPETVDRLSSQIPAVAAFMGESKKGE